MNDNQNELIVYRCTDCGKASVSLGWIHAHIEKHQGFGPFNLIPDPRKMGNPSALNKRTEVLRATDYDVLDPSEVDEHNEVR